MNFPIKEILTITKRVLGLPFFMALMLIGFVFSFFTKSWLWLKYGGEAVNYNDKMNRKTLTDLFLRVQGEFSSRDYN